MINIAVLTSGGGTNLQALLDRQDMFPQGRLSLVLSSHAEAFALQRAKKAAIESIVLQPKDFEDRALYTQAIINSLSKRDIGLVVLAGFLYVLAPCFTELYRNKVINVHPSLIPSFCGNGFYGLRVHKAVLDYGCKVTGATVHFASEVTDGGPIILQKSIEVLPDDTPLSLQARVMEQCEWELLPKAVGLFCSGALEVDGRIVTCQDTEHVLKCV